MDNPYLREANSLSNAFVAEPSVKTSAQPEVAKLSFKQLIEQLTDFSFPSGKSRKEKIEWAQENFSDRISAEDYGKVPKSNLKAWRKWKKLITNSLLEESATIEPTEPVLEPDKTVNPMPPEPEITVNPMPPVVAPEPEITLNPMPPLVPEPVEPEVIVNPMPPVIPEPEITVNPMPPVVEPEPEITVNPMPPLVPEPVEPEVIVNPMPPVIPEPEITVNPMPPVVEPEPEITVNPMPPLVLEPVEPEVIVNPMPPEIPEPVEPEVIGNPFPPVIPEPEITVNPMPPVLEPEVIGNPMPPMEGFVPVDSDALQGLFDQSKSLTDLETLNLDDLLSEDIDSAIASLSPSMAEINSNQPQQTLASVDLATPAEELVTQQLLVD